MEVKAGTAAGRLSHNRGEKKGGGPKKKKKRELKDAFMCTRGEEKGRKQTTDGGDRSVSAHVADGNGM